MERYWCLQYLVQENVQEISATVWRENLVRFDHMPYITKVHSLPELAVGTRVSLEVKRIDTLMMEIDTRFKAVEAEATPVEVAIDDTKGVEEVL
jgi:exoribonuclease-2